MCVPVCVYPWALLHPRVLGDARLRLEVVKGIQGYLEAWSVAMSTMLPMHDVGAMVDLARASFLTLSSGLDAATVSALLAVVCASCQGIPPCTVVSPDTFLLCYRAVYCCVGKETCMFGHAVFARRCTWHNARVRVLVLCLPALIRCALSFDPLLCCSAEATPGQPSSCSPHGTPWQS